jgi:hypothetical protein
MSKNLNLEMFEWIQLHNNVIGCITIPLKMVAKFSDFWAEPETSERDQLKWSAEARHLRTFLLFEKGTSGNFITFFIYLFM